MFSNPLFIHFTPTSPSVFAPPLFIGWWAAFFIVLSDRLNDATGAYQKLWRPRLAAQTGLFGWPWLALDLALALVTLHVVCLETLMSRD